MLNEQETPKPHFSGDLAIGVLKIIRASLMGLATLEAAHCPACFDATFFFLHTT
jgi:hypothetical protein